MSKYSPMSKEFQEDAKKFGLTGNQLINKYIEEGKLPNPADIDRKKNNYQSYNKNENDKNNKKYHPCSKEFQEESKRLGLTGYQYTQKLIYEGKIKNPTDIERERKIDIIKRQKFKNEKEYRDHCAQRKGYKNFSESLVEKYWNMGIHSPMSENEECSSYMGVWIGEDVARPILAEIFGGIKERMNYGYRGLEYISEGEYRIDVKTSVLVYDNKGWIGWIFNPKYNKFPDYFLLLGFDDRKGLNLIYIWLIKRDEIIRGREFWKRDCFKITNKHEYLLKLKKYEWSDKLKCLNDIQNKLKEKN